LDSDVCEGSTPQSTTLISSEMEQRVSEHGDFSPQFQSAFTVSIENLQVLGSPTLPCKFLNALII